MTLESFHGRPFTQEEVTLERVSTGDLRSNSLLEEGGEKGVIGLKKRENPSSTEFANKT